MYPLAVEQGIPADEYWTMTYEEILVQVEANKKKREAELREKAQFDYRMGQLMVYAFNDPKKMPEIEKMYPFIKSEEPEELSEEEKKHHEMLKEQELMRIQASAIKGTRERNKHQS